MKHKFLFILLVIVIIVIINAFYIVDERQQAVITQFGDPIGGPIQNAGLHLKAPFIQKVNYFEKRILEWDGDPKQIPTADKRYIWLDTFSRWRIIDPLKFFQTTRTETAAHSRLDDIISGTTRDIISSHKLIEIVRNSNRELAFTTEYEQNSLENLNEEPITLGRRAIADSIYMISKPKIAVYGIELIDVRIKRINYVHEVRQKVYERMISERKKIAEKYRSVGQGDAAEILGKMQRELDQIQSEAYRKAQEIKGKADAEATNIYARAYNKDPQFYEFLKTLDTYEKTMNDKNIMIMTTDSDYFKYLKKAR